MYTCGILTGVIFTWDLLDSSSGVCWRYSRTFFRLFISSWNHKTQHLTYMLSLTKKKITKFSIMSGQLIQHFQWYNVRERQNTINQLYFAWGVRFGGGVITWWWSWISCILTLYRFSRSQRSWLCFSVSRTSRSRSSSMWAMSRSSVLVVWPWPSLASFNELVVLDSSEGHSV